jgi:predicted RecB family nuclease
VNANGRGPEWVSKTDMRAYARCPYTFSRLFRREIMREETLPPMARLLIRRGLRFEQDIESGDVPIRMEGDRPLSLMHIPPGEFWDRVRAGGLVLRPPMLENHEEKLFGLPDGLFGERGELLPVEVKFHADVQEGDELELAFYWLLLESYQDDSNLKPRGVLLLRSHEDDGSIIVTMRTVPISSARLRQVRELVEGARRARREGVEPRVCFCGLCRKDPDVLRVVAASGHVRSIYGIAEKHAEGLESVGIANYWQLIDADPETVAEDMWDNGYRNVRPGHIRRWQRQAESVRTQQPILFGEALTLGDRFFVFDTEYDSMTRHVWLAGVCVVRGKQRRYHALWADDPKEQQGVAEQLLELFSMYPDLPLVTWSSAEMTSLRWMGVSSGEMDWLKERNLDLFAYLLRNVHLPIRWMTQKDVERYFGIGREGGIEDGQAALFLFERYLALRKRSPDEAARLRRQLESYNRSDLQGLPTIAARLRSLVQTGARMVPLKTPELVTLEQALGRELVVST